MNCQIVITRVATTTILLVVMPLLVIRKHKRWSSLRSVTVWEAQCSGWSKAYAGEIFDEPMVRADGSVSYSIKFDDGEIRSSVEGALVYGLSSESEVTTPPITATDTENEGQGARERSKIASLANSNESHRFNRGDRVEAQCSGWAKAYAGEIMDAPLVRSDGSVSYSIRFDDGEERSNVDGAW